MIERYYLDKMKDIWSESSYYRYWKEIEMEVLLVRGHKELADKLGNIDITPDEIYRHEELTGHELNSFLDLIEEKLGEDSGEIHKGLTSSDIMDTARGLQFKDSLIAIEEMLNELINILKTKAVKYRKIIIAGRTHGQTAEAMSLGLKFLRAHNNFLRNIERLKEGRKRILTGKISGAVGTYSLVSPLEEKDVLNRLGLEPMAGCSQVIPRDIYAEYLFLLGEIAASCENIATEIRLLSQSGIKEVMEPFTSKQKGSSAMPHKKNPVICERICGLARLIASNISVSMTNISLWNERDISHSSNERVILEQSTSLCYYILVKTKYVLENLYVDKERIEENLASEGIKLFSSAVLKLLLDKGKSRKNAYQITKTVFMEYTDRNEICNELKKHVNIEDTELEKIFDYDNYLEHLDYIYENSGIPIENPQA